MNYLAHAFLSGNNNNLLIGNFIADHVRGNNFDVFTKEIVEGIYLHRRIDSFTDAHPLFKESKRFFYDGYERYSGILVDIYFDHLLAKNFRTYSEVSLENFSANVYKVYSAHERLLPRSSSSFLDYVLKNNIYASYAKELGIQQVLYHLSHRIRHGVILSDSFTLFTKHQAALEQNFEIFFKEAIREFKVSNDQ